ncbi:MAG: NADH-quinone oxidoreductase subunit N, partial [Pedobacter sp.]
TYSSALAVFISIIFFSLAGIPPLAGFFIKFFLFQSVFSVEFLLNPSFFIILVTSVVSAFYYIRVVRFTFFDGGRVPALFVGVDIRAVFLFVTAIFYLIFFIF